jgi:hypothetical protein
VSGEKQAEPMSGRSRAESVVVVVRRRPRLCVYIRAYPKTGEDPTPAQLAARLAFAGAAEKARGVKYAGKRGGLPPAAERVAEALEGLSFQPHTARLPQWVERLAERLKLTEEEKAVLKRRILEALASR